MERLGGGVAGADQLRKTAPSVSGAERAAAVQQAVSELMRCVNGSRLQVPGFGPALTAILDSSPEVWSELSKRIASCGGDPIASVKVAIDPNEVSKGAMDALCRGLGELPSLTKLEFELPLHASDSHLDLSELPKQGQPIRIQVSGRSGLQVTVPARAKVKAIMDSDQPAAAKGLVHALADDGDRSTQTLRNMVYYRQDKESLPPSCLNGAAEFALPRWDSKNLPAPTRLIVCRHITASWLDARQAHRAERQAAARPGVESKAGVTPKPRFSAKPFRTAEAISASVPLEQEERYYAALNDGPDALLKFDTLGEALHHQIETMRRGKEAARSRVLVTDQHAIGLDLQVKEESGQPAYVVCMADPNSIPLGKHVRCVVDDPSDLAAHTLSHWTKSTPVSALSRGEPHIAALVPWPPERAGSRERPRRPDIFLSAQDRESNRFIEWTFRNGDVDRAMSLLDKALNGPIHDEAVMEAVAHGGYLAALHDRDELYGKYLERVLAAPAEQISWAEKSELARTPKRCCRRSTAPRATRRANRSSATCSAWASSAAAS
jgi:hypothetical protein